MTISMSFIKPHTEPRLFKFWLLGTLDLKTQILKSYIGLTLAPCEWTKRPYTLYLQHIYFNVHPRDFLRGYHLFYLNTLMRICKTVVKISISSAALNLNRYIWKLSNIILVCFLNCRRNFKSIPSLTYL